MNTYDSLVEEQKQRLLEVRHLLNVAIHATDEAMYVLQQDELPKFTVKNIYDEGSIHKNF